RSRSGRSAGDGVASIAVPRRSLSYAEARARVLGAATPLPPVTLPLAECIGRALAADAIAPHDLPPFRNSAMDGWAVRSADVAGGSEGQGARLRGAGTIAAGAGVPHPLAAGTAARIMTGAMLPEGADAVIALEEGPADPAASALPFTRPAPAGQH